MAAERGSAFLLKIGGGGETPLREGCDKRFETCVSGFQPE